MRKSLTRCESVIWSRFRHNKPIKRQWSIFFFHFYLLLKLTFNFAKHLCPNRYIKSSQFCDFLGCKHVQNRVTLIKPNFALRKFQKIIIWYFQDNRSQSNDFKTESRLFALKVKFMSTKTNVKIYNLISFLVCILFRMEKRSVRTFDKYITFKLISF